MLHLSITSNSTIPQNSDAHGGWHALKRHSNTYMKYKLPMNGLPGHLVAMLPLHACSTEEIQRPGRHRHCLCEYSQTVLANANFLNTRTSSLPELIDSYEHKPDRASHPCWSLLLACLVGQLLDCLSQQVLFPPLVSIFLGCEATLIHPFNTLIAKPAPERQVTLTREGINLERTSL